VDPTPTPAVDPTPTPAEDPKPAPQKKSSGTKKKSTTPEKTEPARKVPSISPSKPPRDPSLDNLPAPD
jgi:hypothetical protein